jgi:hypothetical protein
MFGRMEDARGLRISVLVLCVVAIVHDIAALAINPDFGIGANAQTVKFLWVDYNGWHAVAGLGLFVPGLFVWRRAGLTRVYALALVLALLVTAAWGLLDQNPLAILSFPDQRADAIFHIGVAGLLVLPVFVDAIRGAVSSPS